MTRNELKKLHATATVARNTAHRAYEIALKNRQSDGDTREAYDALLQANQVRDEIYRALLASV